MSASSPSSSSDSEQEEAPTPADFKLEELRTQLLNIVDAAISSFAKDGHVGSATGTAPGPSSSSSSGTNPSAPLPHSVASQPAAISPATTPTTATVATVTAATPAPTLVSAPAPAAPQPIHSPALVETHSNAPDSDGDALATYISSASPFAADLDSRLKVIRRQVQAVPVGNGVTFPQSSNIGLTKDEKTAVARMQDSFKLFRTILQVTARMALRFPEAAEEIEDIATVALVGMRTLLRARDETWMSRALPPEALPAFRALEGSSVMAQDRDRFFGALKFAALKQQASKSPSKPPSKWKNSGGGSSSSSSLTSSSSFSKGKKPYYNNKQSSSSGHGAGPSATQD